MAKSRIRFSKNLLFVALCAFIVLISGGLFAQSVTVTENGGDRVVKEYDFDEFDSVFVTGVDGYVVFAGGIGVSVVGSHSLCSR